MVSQRLLRYAVFLQGFDYEVQHITSKENVLADALSRIPLPECEENDCRQTDKINCACLNQMHQINDILPVKVDEIREETQKDT